MRNKDGEEDDVDEHHLLLRPNASLDTAATSCPTRTQKKTRSNRRKGQTLIVLAAALYATSHAFVKRLTSEHVDLWLLLFLRGSVTVLSNIAVTWIRRGWEGVLRVLKGLPEPESSDHRHGHGGTYSSVRGLVQLYFRALLGLAVSLMLMIDYNFFMNFADTFALFLGSMTMFGQAMAVCLLGEKIRLLTVVGGLFCFVGTLFVTRPSFLFSDAAAAAAVGPGSSALGTHHSLPVAADAAAIAAKNGSAAAAAAAASSSSSSSSSFRFSLSSSPSPPAAAASAAASASAAPMPSGSSPASSSGSGGGGMPRAPSMAGILLTMGAGLCSGGFSVATRHVAVQGYSAETLMHAYMVAFTMLAAALMGASATNSGQAGGHGLVFPYKVWHWALVVLFIAATQIGQLANSIGFKYEGAAVGAVLSNTEMLFAFLLDSVFLADSIQPISALGAFIIFVGGCIAAAGKAAFGGDGADEADEDEADDETDGQADDEGEETGIEVGGGGNGVSSRSSNRSSRSSNSNMPRRKKDAGGWDASPHHHHHHHQQQQQQQQQQQRRHAEHDSGIPGLLPVASPDHHLVSSPVIPGRWRRGAGSAAGFLGEL